MRLQWTKSSSVYDDVEGDHVSQRPVVQTFRIGSHTPTTNACKRWVNFFACIQEEFMIHLVSMKLLLHRSWFPTLPEGSVLPTRPATMSSTITATTATNRSCSDGRKRVISDNMSANEHDRWCWWSSVVSISSLCNCYLNFDVNMFTVNFLRYDMSSVPQFWSFFWSVL